MKLGVAAAVSMLFLGASLFPRSAEAALTSSEKGQIRDFVSTARVENAVRVRSLVARTDLTVEESTSALTDAVVPVAFTDPRAAFLRELAFGASSEASRPLLAQVVTRALLARADSVFQRASAGFEHDARAVAELVAIYSFLDGTLANAGRPTLDAHDATAGISAAAYQDCSKVLLDHIERNARWLKGDGPLAESVARVRAEVDVLLLDMLPDGLTRRVDAADRLGLKGARRQMLTDWGIVVQDAGKLDEPRAARVREALVRLPGARVDLELVYAGEDRGPLRARGLVAYALAASGAVSADANPFGEELTASVVDAGTSAIVHELAIVAVKHAMDNRAELRLQAERDAAAGAGAGEPGRLLGKPHAPSVDHVVGAAAHLLVLDAPRALDLAFVRMLGGHPESAALLSDAIGALATFAVPSAGGAGTSRSAGLSLELGKAAGSTTMSQIRLAPNGAAIGFVLDGHTWTLARAPNGAVTAVTRDGQPLSLSQLATARPPRHAGPRGLPGTVEGSRAHEPATPPPAPKKKP